jgi:hypothetical protein
MSGHALYAVYNRHCAHVLGVHADRRVWEPFIARMQAAGNWSLRTRVATDEDLLAVIRGDRCERCEAAGGQS